MRENLVWPLQAHASVVADRTGWALTLQIRPPDPRGTLEYLRLSPARVRGLADALPAAAARFAELKATLPAGSEHVEWSGPDHRIRIRVNGPGEGLCVAPCRWEYGTTLYDVTRTGELVAALRRAEQHGAHLVATSHSPGPSAARPATPPTSPRAIAPATAEVIGAATAPVTPRGEGVTWTA